MKIKVKKITYDELLDKKAKPLCKPKKTNILFRTLLKLVSLPDLWATKFKCSKELKKYKTNKEIVEALSSLEYVHFIEEIT